MFLPSVGEVVDVYVLLSPDSTGGERAIAAVSLVLTGVTLGASVNFGGAARGLRALDAAGDAAAPARAANTVDYIGEVRAVLAPRGVDLMDEVGQLGGELFPAEKVPAYFPQVATEI